MPACGATSAHTSRERTARRRVSPSAWPVMVTNPKLRIEAPSCGRIAVDDDDLEPASRGGERVCEPHDARADDGQVERFAQVASFTDVGPHRS